MKLFSWGVGFFVILPLIGAVVFLSTGHWILGICSILFVTSYIGTISENNRNRLSEFESDYRTEFTNRNLELYDLYASIGSPECRDGTFSDRQNAIWAKANKIQAEFDSWNEQMRSKLVDMEMGHFE